MAKTKTDFKQQLKPLQNPHPGIDLERAYRRFLQLHDKARGKEVFKRTELISGLNFTMASGTANTVISALVHFGLLDKHELDYSYSTLAKNLLAAQVGSEKYYDLLKQSALLPELYEWLHKEYENKKLPAEVTDRLLRKYKQRNIGPNNVRQVINNYTKTLTFAGLNGSDESDTSERDTPDEYVEISFKGKTVLVYKRYLIDAIRFTRDDEMREINETLS